jgi:ribosomal protein S18 acetylase RimI-like enzyme
MPAMWRARSFSDCDADTICGWVQGRYLLQLVSSDDADRLTPGILARWLGRAIHTVVIANEATDEPVGFCTLSSTEVLDAPPSFVEICHLIVDPHYRYLFIGPRICKAAKVTARQHGFSGLHGRVVPQHRFGIALAQYERFLELAPPPLWLPTGFRWFRHPIAVIQR